MSIYQIAWGATLILAGIIEIGVVFPYLAVLLGIALIVAGIAFILGK